MNKDATTHANDTLDRIKKTGDADDAVWEKNEDGTVVRRQPSGNTDQRDAASGPYVQR